jgi:hypothetical protein
MAQLKEVSVGFTFTKNLGNYQSLRVDAGLVLSLAPGDNPQTVYAEAWQTAKQQVKQGIEAVKGEVF